MYLRNVSFSTVETVKNYGFLLLYSDVTGALHTSDVYAGARLASFKAS